VDKFGNPRELHLEKALDVLNYKKYTPEAHPDTPVDNGKLLAQCKYFETIAYHVDGEQKLPLDSSTFHMTLHDLVNGQPEDSLRTRMQKIEPMVKSILGDWKDHEPISMEATWMFNMVSTSIVLGLKPADPDSYARLDAMYSKLEEVIPLGYPLCPHITLAYFRPGVYAPEQIQGLCRRLRAVDLRVALKAENLVFQNFAHMNHYYPA
jgi:hypothetical protein